ncbi:MAG TPA: glycosyltransferase family 2 protein [Gemmatimonadaceae bacterium]|nr:glycosyltransferase family 2 protein [Gemmatimonadaceae bacterium]
MSAEATVPVTVVIAARNEAANIGPCVESLRWASEIIVVENDSTDDTVERARSAGAIVISNPFITIGQQRNVAIARSSSEWILVVDADERGSPALAAEIRDVIMKPSHDGYRIRRRNFFLGQEIRHGGWEHDRPLRLFRSQLRYNASRVHEHVETSGSIGELTAPLTHSPYESIDQYFEKLDRYSRWWAEDRFDRGKQVGAFAVVSRPPARFVRMYILKGGWMDGAAGAVLACLASASVMAKYARLWALRHQNRN